VRGRQNELGSEFKGARRDWWDPGEDGRGGGRPAGLSQIVAILEDAALSKQRYDPRFGGGEEPLLRRWDEVFNRWYAQQLHHTAIGLPFQPQPEGPVVLGSDEAATFAAFRILLTAYWMYGQQIFLLYEHFGGDMTEYQGVFLDGLRQQADVAGFEGEFRPYTR
jgi:hypothetical protein